MRMRKVMKMNYKKLSVFVIMIAFIICNCIHVFAEEINENDDIDWEVIEENIYLTEDGSYYYYYNPETGFIAQVEDDADRLTEDEEYWLLFDMYAITDFGDVYYKSITDNPYSDADDYAEYYLNDEKDCYGGSSGTVLLDDTINRRLEIFSNGIIHEYITNGKAVSITDNVYKYASNGEYYNCASEAFYEMATLLYGGRIAEPMKYVSNFFFAIIISLTICFILANATSSKSKASVEEVMKAVSKNLVFTEVNKVFAGKTRVYDPPSTSDSDSDSDSDSGGGGGGGHSY